MFKLTFDLIVFYEITCNLLNPRPIMFELEEEISHLHLEFIMPELDSFPDFSWNGMCSDCHD